MVGIVEAGELSLWYVPRAGVEVVTEVEEVGQLGMILAPDGEAARSLIRLPEEELPTVIPSTAGPWQARTAEVLAASDSLPTLLERLEEGGQGAARLAAEARYALYRDDDEQVHLAYRLVAPDAPGLVQTELGLRPEAEYLLAVRVPGEEPAFEPPRSGQLAAPGAELQFGAAGLKLPELVRDALASRREQAPATGRPGLADQPWRAEPAETGRWR